MSKRARLIDSLRIGRVQREIEPRLCWRRKKGDRLSFRQIENPMLIARSSTLLPTFNFNLQLRPVFLTEYRTRSSTIPIYRPQFAFHPRFRDLVDGTKGNFFVIHRLRRPLNYMNLSFLICFKLTNFEGLLNKLKNISARK